MKSLLLITAFLSQPPPEQMDPAQPTLTLKQAQELAREQNIDIEIGRERLAQGSAMASKAWAAILPVISANASITRFDKEIVIPFGLPPDMQPLWDTLRAMSSATGSPDPGPFPDPVNITMQKLYQKGAMASFSWVLLSAPAILGIQNAQQSVDAAALSYEQMETSLVFATSLAFFNLLNTNEQMAIRERALKLSEEHLRLAEAKVAVGEATRLVQLRSEVEVATAQQNLLQARTAARIAQESLANLIGYVEPNGTVRQFSVVRTPPPPPPDSERLLDIAHRDRLDLKLADVQLSLAERNKRQTWLKYLPMLVGTGNYRWSEVEGFSGEKTNWQLGLALQWNLFEGNLRYWELEERAHEVNIANLTIQKIKDNIAQQTNEARLNFESAQANLKVAERRVELARQSAELVNVQFEVGAATQLDLLDANRALADAETAAALAHLVVDIAGLSLEHSTKIPPVPGA